MSSPFLAVRAVRAVKETKLRNPKTINHLNSISSKKAKAISDAAAFELRKITKQIQEDLFHESFEIVREKYKNKIGTIIASAARESFFNGFAFVEKFAGKSLVISDLSELNALISKNIESYWNAIQKAYRERIQTSIHREILNASGSDILTAVTSFLNALTISLSFMSLNRGTVEASRTLPLRSTNIENANTLMWVSERDAKVCPICQNFDGRVWNVEDSDIQYPVENSHFNCRCRLLPFINGKAFDG